MYFQQWYPNNKFITQKEVEIICKKYGLLFGEANYYKGDIPEKNLVEIEAFKLREEDKDDCFDYESYRESSFLGSMSNMSALQGLGRRSGIDRMYEMAMMQTQRPRYKGTPNGKKQQQGFKICAPEKDFDTRYMEVVDGYKLQYDPIVLQPVKEGFLIISKWGLPDEANKELANEKLN